MTKKGIEKEINPQLFENEYEETLYKEYLRISTDVSTLLTNGQEKEGYLLLASLKEVINAYFDHTMVMAENEIVKENRLAQMVKLSKLIQSFAQMNNIIVK